MNSVSRSTGDQNDFKSRSPEPAQSGRHRPKVTRACDKCRRNKIKCTGGLPCPNCVKSKAGCSYDIPYTRGKAPAPKPLPQHEQNNYLEKTRPAQTPSRTSQAMSSRTLDDDYEMHEGNIETAEVLENGGEAGVIEPETCTHHTYDAIVQHQPSNETFQSRNSNLTAWNSPPFSHHSSIKSAEMSIFSYGDAPFPKFCNSFFVLPTVDKAQEMVAKYFYRTSGTYQILHRRLVERKVEEMYANGMIQSDTAMNSSRALVLMVFAIAQDLEAPQQNDEKIELGYRYFNLSETLLQSATGPPTHIAISAYLLQCFFLLSHSRINQGYHVLGTAISLVFSSRLNLKAFDIDEVTAECNARALLGAYTLDKYFSTALGRVMRLKDSDIDQTLLNDSELPSQISDAFGLQYRLARITSLIHTTSYSLSNPSPRNLPSWTRTIQKDLLSWHKTYEAQRASLSSRQSTILNLSYLGNIILLHLPFLMRDMDTNSEIRWDIEQTINAATETCSIINSLSENNQTISWLERYCGYNASLVLYIFILTHLPSLPTITVKSHHCLASRCQLQVYQLAQHPSCFSARCAKVLDEAKAEVLARMQVKQNQQESETHHSSSHFAGEWGNMEFDREAPGGGVLNALLSLVGGVRVREGGIQRDREKSGGSIVERIRGSGWTGLLGY